MTDTPQLPDDVRRFLVDMKNVVGSTWGTQAKFMAAELLDKYAPPEPEWLPGDVIFYMDHAWVRDSYGNWSAALYPSAKNIYKDSAIERWTNAIVLVKRGRPRIDPNAPIYMSSAVK